MQPSVPLRRNSDDINVQLELSNKNQDGSVGVASSLRAGWSGGSNSGRGKGFFYLKNCLIRSEAHPAFYSVGTGVCSQY